MQRVLFLLAIVPLTESAVDAQNRQFPYKVRVVVPEVYVRSGPGEAFYPTRSLSSGAIVNVQRHDPGGWYVIDPPEGSFSWIPTKYVRSTGSGAGELIESNVVVFVGSSFGDETHVWQRKLMAGEKVSILGERQIDTLSGPKQMFKIAPPAREFRWIPGSAVVPVGKDARARVDRNPYSVPTHLAEQNAARQPIAGSAQKTQPHASRFSPSQRLVKLKKIREEQRNLQSIDQRFRSMILSDPSLWDLDAIEQEYRKLQDSATYKPVAGQIDLRYPAINRYRQRKAQFEDFERLTSETEKRDAELLATQFGVPQPGLNSQLAIGPFSQPTTRPFMNQPSFVQPGTVPVPDPGFGSIASIPTTPADNLQNIPSGSRYIGAGIVQRRAGADGNDYVLTSPSGRVLARLMPDKEINLNKHVGKSVGLHGKRWFDQEEKTDRIEVSSVEEVRLRN